MIFGSLLGIPVKDPKGKKRGEVGTALPVRGVGILDSSGSHHRPRLLTRWGRLISAHITPYR